MIYGFYVLIILCFIYGVYLPYMGLLGFMYGFIYDYKVATIRVVIVWGVLGVVIVYKEI